MSEESNVSYNKEDILGCSHYPRNCMIRAACCGKFFVCRLCHNDKSNHEINRFDTKEIRCMKCQTVQPVAETCSNESCNIQFAKYFCEHCKFYDDTPNKQIFHCIDCKICRVGKREDYKHCLRCNGCLPIDGFDKHKCLDNKYADQCPICMEDMFSSRDPPHSLPCGHALHSQCYKGLIKSRTIQCPICKRSIGDYDWAPVDEQLAREPMPRMYRGSTCSILCCDCDTKSMDIAFHFIGNKCTKCGSYNTTIISKNMKIDPTAIELDNTLLNRIRGQNNNNNNNNQVEEHEEEDDDEEYELVEDEEDEDEEVLEELEELEAVEEQEYFEIEEQQPNQNNNNE